MEEALYRKTLATRRQHLGDTHAATSQSMASLGRLLMQTGRYAEAEALLLEALPLRQAHFGPTHRATHAVLRALIALYDAWGRAAKQAVYQARLDVAVTQINPCCG